MDEQKSAPRYYDKPTNVSVSHPFADRYKATRKLRNAMGETLLSFSVESEFPDEATAFLKAAFSIFEVEIYRTQLDIERMNRLAEKWGCDDDFKEDYKAGSRIYAGYMDDCQEACELISETLRLADAFRNSPYAVPGKNPKILPASARNLDLCADSYQRLLRLRHDEIETAIEVAQQDAPDLRPEVKQLLEYLLKFLCKELAEEYDEWREWEKLLYLGDSSSSEDSCHKWITVTLEFIRLAQDRERKTLKLLGRKQQLARVPYN